MDNRRKFHEDLKKSVQASLVAAGYHATYQSSQKWMASFNVSSRGSQGGVSLFFDGVCEKCGESLPYRVINTQGAFGGRVTFPVDGDPATVADRLVREILPLLTNRLPAAAPHSANVGVGLLSPQKAGQLSEALQDRAGAH